MILAIVFIVVLLGFGALTVADSNRLEQKLKDAFRASSEASELNYKRWSAQNSASLKLIERVEKLEKSLNQLSNRLDDSMIGMGDLREDLKKSLKKKVTSKK